ncbi:MAG: hypothetical protein R3C44_05855 [Chloroflexota bacterium]
MLKNLQRPFLSAIVFIAGVVLAARLGCWLQPTSTSGRTTRQPGVTNRVLIYLPATNDWHLINTDDGSLVATVDAYGPEAYFNCDGSRFIVNDLTGGIQIWDSVSGQLINQLYLGVRRPYSGTQLRDWVIAPAIMRGQWCHSELTCRARTRQVCPLPWEVIWRLGADQSAVDTASTAWPALSTADNPSRMMRHSNRTVGISATVHKA